MARVTEAPVEAAVRHRTKAAKSRKGQVAPAAQPAAAKEAIAVNPRSAKFELRWCVIRRADVSVSDRRSVIPVRDRITPERSLRLRSTRWNKCSRFINQLTYCTYSTISLKHIPDFAPGNFLLHQPPEHVNHFRLKLMGVADVPAAKLTHLTFLQFGHPKQFFGLWVDG